MGEKRGCLRTTSTGRSVSTVTRAGAAVVVVQRSVKRACRVRTVVELQSCSAEERGLEIGIWRGWDLARAGAGAAVPKKSRRAGFGSQLNFDAGNAAPRPALGTLCDDCRCRQLSNRGATRSGGEKVRSEYGGRWKMRGRNTEARRQAGNGRTGNKLAADICCCKRAAAARAEAGMRVLERRARK